MDGYPKLNSNSIISSIKIDPPISICDRIIIRAEESEDNIKLIFDGKVYIKEPFDNEYTQKQVILQINHFKDNLIAYRFSKKTRFHQFRFIGSYDNSNILDLFKARQMMVCEEFYNHGEVLLICNLLKKGLFKKDYIAFRIPIDNICLLY